MAVVSRVRRSPDWPWSLAWALLLWLLASPAAALPSGPNLFCEFYPDSPTCGAGTTSCATCHLSPPKLNPYGIDLSEILSPTVDAEDYAVRLPVALSEVELLDSDGDGLPNLAEIEAGSEPGDPASRSVPRQAGVYDPRFAYRRVSLDVCGEEVASGELESVSAPSEVVNKLRSCLSSDFWVGVDGELWKIAFPKVRPRVPFSRVEGAFEPDLNLFVYTQTGDRDARELLTASYAVERDDRTPPVYRALTPTGPRAPDPSTRAGMLTTTWFNASNTMGQSIPRVTAAQAYRAYLGFDLSVPEGLFDPEDEEGQLLHLVDYDDKGVDAADCAVCHRTLDPLAYMFSRYAGAGETRVFGDARPRPPPSGHYAENRMEYFVGYDGGQGLLDVPETGALFGVSGYTLVEWARAAADSDAFARNLVLDYCRHFIGGEPTPDRLGEFNRLWRSFMNEHRYRVELMLEALVVTEAYGVPR